MMLIESLQLLQDKGVKILDIYYAELIVEGESVWSVDVMSDEVNNLSDSSWTFTIYSLLEFENILKEDHYYVCDSWEIITDRPFSTDVVCAAVDEWLLSNNITMTTRMIELDDAVGSGYVKSLREMDLEREITNATPLDEYDDV